MIKFPFFTLQELNLDWLMAMLKKILAFMPIDSGVAGDVLQRGTDGATWQPISAVSLDIHGLNSAADLENADEFPIYDNSAQGNYKTTLADILAKVPPDAVDSVNGQTGAVVLDASDVGALPDTTVIPDSTSDLINDAGFVDAAGAAAAAPVQSVNGQTGAVVLAMPNLYFGNSAQTLTAVIDPNVDPNNNCSIIEQGISLYRTADKKIIRLCGLMKITTGTNPGWHTFVIENADVADMTELYTQCDFTCSMYADTTPARTIILSYTGSYVNYRVNQDKTIYVYVYIGSGMISSGDNLIITFNGIPIEIK